MGCFPLPMNCIDTVFITAVPSGESLCTQTGDLPGDHKPIQRRGKSASGAATMATAAPGPRQERQQGQEGRQSPPFAHSSFPSRPAAPTDPPADGILVNVAGTRYSVVSLVAEELGMKVTEDNVADCDLFWIDSGIGTERFLSLKHYQHVNHFPGMGEICRKDSLGRNMERLRKLHKEEFNFVPRTWVLPGEYHSLVYHMRELKRRRKNKTFIVKPHNSAMGNGIYLTRSVDSIHKEQSVVVQEYLEKPFLLDGFKIDLRVYVLVTSCNPLRIFVYRDGLVRFSTEPYVPPTDANIDKQFMHLTNYSINKHSDSFDGSEEVDRGSKRTLQYFNTWLTQNEYSVGELWAKIHDIIIKTLIVTFPHLVHSYQACRPGRSLDQPSQFFEILGFDIFVDSHLTPWLLEVNRAPSFATDSKLDLHVKSGVIRDALRIVNIQSCDKKRKLISHRMASRRRLVGPNYSTKCSRYNFIAEQEGAAYELAKKKREVRGRLEQLRREKAQLEHEQQSMGGYTRIYPSTDWTRDKLYKTLLKSASAVTLIGERQSIYSEKSPIHRLKEHELLDLLSQYEDEEKAGGVAYSGYVLQSGAAASVAYQPLSMESSHHPMEPVYQAMAVRVAEEEQTQRTMIALNEMKPTYPGKSSKELTDALNQVDSSLVNYLPELAKFWLVSLDGRQRKQLLCPLKDSLTSILSCYWRTTNMESVRLHQIFTKLFNFLLSSGGKGMWAVFAPKEKPWEEQFKAKSSVISVIEMVCCRKIVELSQATVKAAFYFHHLNHPYHASRNRSSFSCSITCPRSHPLPTITKPHPPGPSYSSGSSSAHHASLSAGHAPSVSTSSAVTRPQLPYQQFSSKRKSFISRHSEKQSGT